MNQEEIESRVREIFEDQGFKVKQNGNEFHVEGEDFEREVAAFSSEEFELEDLVDSFDTVFVNEELDKAKDSLETEVSVLKEREDRDIDMPSYEIIGEIAVINELVDHTREEAVELITEQHPNVKTVLLKTEPLSGEFRVGEYEKLYGEETETIHKEFGCHFKVDPTEVFFSEREAVQRKKVAEMIEDGEDVMVFFAGVAPYPIIISSLNKEVRVCAVEKNPDAVKYARKNLELNDVGESVKIFEADVSDFGINKEFDTVVMPSPSNSVEFLEAAESCVKDDGRILMYVFGSSKNDVDFRDIIFDLGLKEKSKKAVSHRSPSETKFIVELVPE